MAASTGTVFNALGRIVWGHPLKLVQRKDQQTQKPILKDDGSPAMQTVFGLAVPKAEFMANIWPLMQAEAGKGYPQGVPQNFSWKLDDGDGIDSNGKPFAEREGYAGCYILTVASNTGFPPALYKWNGSSYDQLTAEQLKCGDYVNVAINCQINIPQQRTHTPSLYINPQAIEFVGYGKEIISVGVNPMTAFGGRQHALPPGASAMPVAGAPNGVNMPGAGMPGQPPQGGQPMPGYAPQPAPMAMPGQQPQYAPQPAPMAPAPVPVTSGYPPQGGQPMQPQYAPQGGQPMQPQYAPQPAHDFVQGGQPMQPQYAPQPGMMPGNAATMPGAMGTAPMPAPGGYAQQPGMSAMASPSNPGMMPGMMPPR